MKPYVLERIPPNILSLFCQVREVVAQMPDVDLGTRSDGGRATGRIDNGKIRISCHVLTRALAACFPVKVKDGYFMGIWEHSWLVAEGGFTIDPYPVALVGGSILLDTGSGFSPWTRDGVYTEHSLSFEEDPRFSEYVAKVTAAVRQTAECLGCL